ncbi:MAG: adenylate/guanylate cyclase domain-containing protein, partial [Anaerolineales bacterium]
MSLPQGTVTFLFSDIEGSTRLLHQLGENYDRLLADQRRILRDAFQKWDGQEIDTQGDSFFAAFPKAYDAVAAAADIQQAITKHKWPERVEVRLRIGLHTGEPRVAEEGYVGIDVHRAARVGNLGHGGQVLLSETTVALVRDELPKGVGLLALGQHRLKDFERPEPLSQLVIEGLPSEFPVLKSPGVRPIHLPIPSTPFIGRRKELDELSALIQDPDTRLITIFGVGGMGKTRLAIAAGETQTEPSNGRDAEKKQQFPDGIFFVSLAPLDSSDRLVSTIAEEVGFRFFEGVETRKQLLDFFREKSLLLILDNFEHLLDAASLIAEIVAVAPKVKVLTTTREKLNLSCETIFPLGGLAYPTYDTNSEDDIDALPNTYSAITLFLQTARRVNPSVKLTRENLVAVKEICQQVGGIPLGIELAAGWMEVLPAEKISLKIQENLDFLTAARRDLPDRHQSLRAVFSSTWEMLDDQLQEVFSKLTVFHGGFTHEAALDVAGASLNQLRTLLNKSLIQSLGDNRLEIHELLRQYGGEKLAQDEQHKIRVRDLHSRYFASYVEQNEEHTLFGNLESLRSEIDNILIGIRWAVKREFDHEITKQMMSMNTWFEQSGRREEGRDF